MITRNPSSQKDPMRKFLNEDLILNRRWSLLGRVPPRLPPFTARTRVTLANPGEVERAHLKQIYRSGHWRTSPGHGGLHGTGIDNATYGGRL
jgi:hypothetical protein